MKSKDSDTIQSVADEVQRIMLGEEPDQPKFKQELEKTQGKASKKKTPEEEAGVAKAAVQAVKVEDVNIFDLPLDTMSEADVISLKALTKDAMDAVPLSKEQSELINRINVIRERYKMTPLQILNSEGHDGLHGGQKNIDMNKNNKIDAEDFKMLRAKKKPAKRTVTIDKPDRLVSMKVSKEEVDQIDEVEVLPKGVTRHKAKLAMGAKYGASDYGRGGEEEQEMRKSMTRKTEPKKRGSYGARQNIVRGTRVSGKDVNEDVKDMKKVAKELAGASKMHKKQSERVQKHVDQMSEATFFDKLTLLEEAPLEAISLSLQEGKLKDLVTGHMDKGHSYDDAMKKAQADLDKMKKPKQMSLPLSKQKANEEYEQLDEKKHKKKHSCAEKVKSEEYGIGYCIPEMHTMLEDGTVTHYDVEFEDCIVENYPVSELKILKEAMHEHYDNEEKNKQLEEGTPTKKQVKQGIGIARDKRYAKGNMSGAVKAMDKVNKGLAQHPAVAKELRKQNEEHIDELKTPTLKSYISKANKDLSKRVADYHSKDIASSPSKIIKRDLAIDKAKGRLSMNRQLGRPEESVQIDELSPKTLGDYATKAGGDLSRRSYKAGVSTIATDRPGGSDKDMKKIANRTTGLARAARKLVDKGRKMKGGVPESVEHIDELDTKTLMSYRDKAEDDQVDRAMDMKGNTPKARKRAMGIEKAKGRLQMKAQLYGGRPGQSSYKGGHLNPVKKEEVEYIVEKNVPNNPKLWSRAKSLAKQKFDVYPSAYANGWAARWYKSKGGTWRKGK